MKALYSLVCRLRTLSALTQGMVTLAVDGWTAVTPAQWLLLGCGLCILVRVLVPSPSSRRGKRVAVGDSLVSVAAAVSVVILAAESLVDAGLLLGRLASGV